MLNEKKKQNYIKSLLKPEKAEQKNFLKKKV